MNTFEEYWEKFGANGSNPLLCNSAKECAKHAWEAAVATHRGGRMKARGACEKCGTQTNWVVNVSGRRAYWCGCG